MPNLRQLEYLVALADTRNFRRAAERANTTQPTLSEQLKALEQRLGCQLVERARSQALMTPVGAQVVEIARRMLADAGEIKSLAQSGGRELAGVLRLGLPPTIGPYLLPALIPALRQRYPQLKLYVREEIPSQLPAGLADGRLDLVMSLLPVKNNDLVSEPLFREPLHLAMPAGHPLTKKKTVHRNDLENEDVLALGPGHQLHDVVLDLCKEFGARLRYDYEGTSLDTLREMVAMGLGVTFLPGLYVNAVAQRDETILTCQLKDQSIHRTVGLIWRASTIRHEQYTELANLLRQLVKNEFTGLKIMK